jgi:anti-sigma regulatory factor (Ser/Thr protein kinase)
MNKSRAASAVVEGCPRSRAARIAYHGSIMVTPPRRRTFPGRPDQVGLARTFVARTLDDCPVTDTAVLLASELITNALKHTTTASDGTFDVIVWRGLSAACVAILDDGSDSAPAPREHDPLDLAESGYGLALVDQLSTRWGHHTGDDGTAVWFLLRWP